MSTPENVTITLTTTELATLCDCTPGVYNRLPRDIQLAVGHARQSGTYARAEHKLAAAATRVFTDKLGEHLGSSYDEGTS